MWVIFMVMRGLFGIIIQVILYILHIKNVVGVIGFKNMNFFILDNKVQKLITLTEVIVSI